jgi:chromosome segregation ATPase
MATLVYCDGDGASARLELSDSMVVGSAEGCAIRSRSADVEARHARIFEAGGSYWVEDLSQSSGVFVEAERITQRQVAAGEIVCVGSLMLRVDANGESRPLVAAAELARLLAVALVRNRDLTDERNALGRRVGELHAELAEERDSAAVVIGPPRDAVEYDLIDTTAPMASGFAPDLEALSEKVRQTTRAVAELEAKLETAEKRRAEIAERAVEAEAAAASGDATERELREVQLLSLNAQLAELDKTCARKRAKLNARRRELAVLRSKVEADPSRPRRTREYGVPRADTEVVEDSEKLAELKERFETEFARAVTLQQKLKNAEARIDELEGAVDERDAEVERLEGDLENAVDARQGAERKLRDLQSAPKKASEKASETAALERRIGDLEKLLEAAKKEAWRVRRKATEVGESALEGELRIEELEAASASSAEQAAKAATRVAELESALDAKKRELIKARERVAELEAAAARSAEAAVEAERQRQREQITEVEAALARAEKARDSAQAQRREADVRVLTAESATNEMRAKLEVAERRVAEARAEIERLGRALETARGELVEAREEIEALGAADVGEDRENTQVIRLEKKLEAIQKESDDEIELLSGRIKELERDLDRALDAEQVALARADADAARRAEETERLTAQLEEATDELATTSERLSSIRHELAESQDREELLVVARDALESRLDEIASVHAGEIEALRSELETAQRVGPGEVDKVRAELEGELESVRARLEGEMIENRARLEVELEAVRGELTEARERVAELETERRSLLVDRDRALGLERELNNVRNALHETRAEVGGLREELATAQQSTTTTDLRSRVVELASQNAQISAELVALGEMKSRVERDLSRARIEIDTLQRELSGVRHELTDTSKDRNELESLNTDLTRRYEEVAGQLERASIDMEALRDDVARSSRADLERDNRALRERIADLEMQLSGFGHYETTENIARPDTLSDDVELTAVATASPAMIEWMASLQEAIGDLRRQMRTAADEAVMLETNDSVEIISVALSSAVARVEAAREALRNIVELIGLES